MTCLLAYDIGTTGVKTCLFGVRGWNEYIVLAINMALNLSLEYL